MSASEPFLRPGAGPSEAAEAAAAWAAAWQRIERAWPQLELREEEIARFLAERLDGGAPALAAAPVEDLALAAQCVRGDRTAHRAFEAYLAVVEQAKVGGATAELIDEVKQRLRVQLLLGGDEPPGLTAYQGRGALRGWLRIIATRELIRLTRRDPRQSPRELEELELATTGDPELDRLKTKYRAEFAAALREAIADLTFEDRLLLRQQIADELSLDEIGATHGVHRGTAGRWLARARAALQEATRRRLSERLELPEEEVSSVIRLVHSRLDVSVARYLRHE
ncbi:MAG: sigma-70 family RNA polymerase sigma factor [Kofleriaceae bacterium]